MTAIATRCNRVCWCVAVAILLLATSYVADAKEKKDKPKQDDKEAVVKPQLPATFAPVETLHEDDRCHNCSPLLTVPWGDYPGGNTSTGCPDDAWNSPGNEWVDCGAKGDWQRLFGSFRSRPPPKACDFPRALRSLGWCWKPAHPGCVVDAVALLKARSETIVYAGDSLTIQLFEATEAMLRDIFPDATDCLHEFDGSTTANVINCVRLPSGTQLVMVRAKMDFANATLLALLPEEAERCRRLQKTEGYESLASKWRMRSTYPDKACFEWSWLSILPFADVLVMNYGPWATAMEVHSFHEYSAMAGSIMRYIKKKFMGRKVVYRSTFVGHYETCQHAADYAAPLRAPRQHLPPGQDDMYRYYPPIQYERSWVEHAERLGVPLQFVNVTSMYSQRIDGKVDCNHYCQLGPQFWAARIVLMAALA